MKNNKSFVLQLEQTDCGVACLKSALRYFGGDASFEHLRSISGTTPEGTSLLGLYQAAQSFGLATEGLEVEHIKKLQEVEGLAILHVTIDNKLQHYLLYYGYQNGKYVVGDPGKGIIHYSESELSTIWQSKILLTLQTTPAFSAQAFSTRQQWAWLREMLVPHTEMLAVLAFLGVIIAVLNLASAIFSQQLIDKILPSGSSIKLWSGIGLLTLLLVLRSLFTTLRGYLQNRQGRDFNKQLIQRFYDSLLYLPKSFFDSRKTGELLTRLKDSQRIQHTISYLIGEVAIQILVALVCFVVLSIYYIPIAVLSFSVLLAVALVVWQFRVPISQQQKNVLQAYAGTESHYVESVKAIAAIKVNNIENLFSQFTKYAYGMFQDQAFQLGNLRLRFGFCLQVINIIFSSIILAWACYAFLEKEILLGELMALFAISNTLLSAVVSVFLSYIQLEEAKVAFERMYEFASLQPEKLPK